MGTLRSEFADSFPNEYFGRVTGTANVTRLPNFPAAMARFQGLGSNIGSIFLGRVMNTGSLPWEIDAGYDTGWFPVVGQNLNEYYYRSPSGTDILVFWVQY